MGSSGRGWSRMNTPRSLEEPGCEWGLVVETKALDFLEERVGVGWSGWRTKRKAPLL